MDTDTVSAPPGALQGLGARLRAARHARGLSQEQIAQPEFTKSYISAVERGKARPSLKALALLAGRLQVPLAELLAAPPSAEEAAPDLAALQAQLGTQLDQAALLLDAAQAPAALHLLDPADQAWGAELGNLPPRLRYRLACLRARAYLQQAEPAAARQE